MVRYSRPVGTNPNLTLTSVGQNDNGNKYRLFIQIFAEVLLQL
jgi:hypothetical protein